MDQVWAAVAGVLVGGFVAGGNSWVQARRDRARELRDQRRVIYADFIRAVHLHLSKPLPASRARMGDAMSVLEIVAPEDTRRVASRAVREATSWEGLQEPVAEVAITDPFIELAKRDLGIRD